MAYITPVGTTTSAFSMPRQRQQRSSQPVFSSRLKAALEHASRLSEMYGTRNIDTVIAWETVKELLRSHPYFSTLVVSGWNLEELE